MASDPAQRPLRLCHVFATFDAGGTQVRAIEVMRTLGAAFQHSVLAADGRIGAAARTPADVPVRAMRRPASRWRQLQDLVTALRRSAPDLVLTYNWGALFGAVAARLVGVPFVHHEEVVPPEERLARLRRRDWLRRAVLPRAERLVVPSRAMAARALDRWRLPEQRICYIANGVDLTDRRPRRPEADRRSPSCVGTVAHARIEKNWPRLLHAFAAIGARDARLLVVGDGPERSAAERLAAALGIGDRARFAGAAADPRPCYDAMDVFALGSDDEQMPLTVLEAMAHGLPIVATDVGDVAGMLPPEQRPFVVPCDANAPAAMARAFDRLLADAALRARLGAANRAHVARHHSLDGVAARYADLYRMHARRQEPLP
jgi:glycosyltransferase involved in cell wall biosynthesis